MKTTSSSIPLLLVRFKCWRSSFIRNEIATVGERGASGGLWMVKDDVLIVVPIVVQLKYVRGDTSPALKGNDAWGH